MIGQLLDWSTDSGINNNSDYLLTFVSFIKDKVQSGTGLVLE